MPCAVELLNMGGHTLDGCSGDITDQVSVLAVYRYNERRAGPMMKIQDLLGAAFFRICSEDNPRAADRGPAGLWQALGDPLSRTRLVAKFLRTVSRSSDSACRSGVQLLIAADH